MRWLALAVVVLAGCWDFHKVIEALHHDPPTFDNRSQYPDGLFYKVWGELESLSQTDISEQGITAIVYEDLGEFEDACPDVTEGLGCSDPYNIHIYGGVGTDFLDVGTAAAHQLAHLHFYQRSDGNDGDGRHAHGEWWGEGGYVDLIHSLIEAGAIQ